VPGTEAAAAWPRACTSIIRPLAAALPGGTFGAIGPVRQTRAPIGPNDKRTEPACGSSAAGPDGEPVGEPLRGHDGAVSAVALRQVEGLIVAVTGSNDKTVRVWDPARGEPVGEPLRGHDEAVAAVAIGQVEGRALAVTGSPDGAVRVWY
jgi:hypothetical protein